MILTTKGRYATMAVVDMIESGNNLPVSLLSISKRQKISLSYLEQIFSRLRKAGIVESVKGPGGGYIINSEKNITVADIIKATGEQVKMTRCGSKKSCITIKDNCKTSKCKTHNLWKGLENTINSYFGSISLQDIAEGKLL
jgi:Rrf2 family transcriptional regulator, iron-sulfur cluster assembly transcription factor